MKRTKLADRVLPTYTKGEEIFNMTSHIVGAGFGLVAMILCVIVAIIHKNIYGIVSGIIYGITVILLYTMSSIYHGLSPKLKGKRVLQILDHCSIFLLIAGSYTPFALCTLREYDNLTGWTIFAIIWILAIIGIILNAIDLKRYKVFSMICYLLMGWCIIIKVHILPELLTMTGFVLLLLGGIVYTIGAILYGVGKKHKYIHSIFHLFILLATILQFLTIILFVM
ncbi:MAG: hemolysin III family protein [Clostridia bacterium]|nr:hemolysin III family protein [Clostridia bacterium]